MMGNKLAAILVLAVATAWVPRSPRALRAAPRRSTEIDEQQEWMISYMAKAHEARLEAIKKKQRK